MNPEIDTYISKSKKWQEETRKLRAIILDCGLTEELKWGKPCYTHQQSNIAIIQGFKDFCALMFFKGALLKDPQKILKKQGENTQAALRIPFKNVQEIIEIETVLKAYIEEAVAIEEKGLKIEFKASKELLFVAEFQKMLDEMPELKAAFQALTPGRQRAYNMFFSAAKQSKTRKSRIQKCVPQIMDGKGLNDR